MTNVLHKLPCEPSRDVMETFVNRMFSALGMRGLVELSWTSVRAPHKLEFARLYDISDLDTLIDDAARLNANPNCNVYISAGLRKPDINTKHRAKDVDVQSIVAFWADFDAPGALDRAIEKAKRLNITPSTITYTGHQPHTRGQMWWFLDEPCEDFALHEQIQRKLAIELGADKSVINRSRVMRLIGGVAWPLKEGRTLEVTGYVDEQPRAAPYTLDEMNHALRGVSMENPHGAMLDFSTAEPTIETEDLIALAIEPHQFHAAALKTTARLTAQGVAPDVIYGMLAGTVKAAGINVQERLADLRRMTQGAALKFTPPPAPQPDQQPAPDPAVSPFLSIAQLLAMPAPEWIVDGFLLSKGMSAIFGPPGAFKSFIALDIGLSVAHGIDWHGIKVEQRKVLYICAEGQYGFGSRALVWQQERVNGKDTDQFALLPVPVNFLEPQSVGKLIEDIERHLGGVGLVIVDTLARNFGVGDENKTQDMNAFVRGVGRLASRCQVIIVHHTGKDESKDERGSSAFRAALETAFRLKREPASDVVTFVTRKQKEAEEQAPINFVMARAEAAHPTTGELLASRLPTRGANAVPTSIKQPSLSRSQLALLATLRAEGRMTVTALALDLKKDKSNVGRMLRILSDRGLVAQDAATLWFVTGDQDED